MSKPTANWERVGNRFYRKVQLYTSVFNQDLDLQNYLVAEAPYSGAVALVRDETKLHAYTGGQSAKPTIDIHTCAGKLLNSINWDRGPIHGLGWSEDERLIVVVRDGTVRIYSDLDTNFQHLTLGHGAEEHGVRSCRFWNSGFVALLGNNQLVAVTNYAEPRPYLLASPPSDPIHSWTIIPPEYTLSRSVEALVAIGKSIMTVDASAAEDRMLENGPFRHLGVSPNGQAVALYTPDGKVWVVSSDFQNRISEYDSKVRTAPNNLLWCGNDAVVLAWEDEFHLIGQNGSASKHYYDSPVHLIPEHDSIKVLSNEACEMVQAVPRESEDVFRIGSKAPAAILLDALDQLEQKSSKADESIQLIRSNLEDAAYTCVKAAGQDYSIHWQKQLLKAASYGKSVVDLYHEVDDFVETCETLRVLNAVRFHEVGLPLTQEQLIRLTPERLVQRLTTRKEYLLALKISEYLRLPVDKIYVHWARHKVRHAGGQEDEICAEILARLEDKRGISFEEIAQAAFDEGRAKLATDLLSHEPRAGKQVPMLLNVHEDVKALDKAIESGDTDLVYHVLLHLRKKLPLASFFRAINGRPVATALVETSAMHQDQDMLKDFYYQDDRRADSANLLLSEALDAARRRPDASTAPTAVTDKLQSAIRVLQDSKEHVLQLRTLDETTRLLALQATLEKDLGGGGGSATAAAAASDWSFRGLSVNETTFKLIKTGNVKRAARMQTEFKIPEKTFWWLRLRALVGRRDWREIEDVGKNRKSPIGWQPFVEEVLAAGNGKLAATFIPKCNNSTIQERIDMWLKCGVPVKAAEEAFKARDIGLLERIRDRASGVGSTGAGAGAGSVTAAGADGNARIEIERMITQLVKR